MLRDERGFGPFREWWASLCSMHVNTDPDCHACKVGVWVPVWKERKASYDKLYDKVEGTNWTVKVGK